MDNLVFEVTKPVFTISRISLTYHVYQNVDAFICRDQSPSFRGIGQMENCHDITTNSDVGKNLERETSPRRVIIELLVSKRFLFHFSVVDGDLKLLL